MAADHRPIADVSVRVGWAEDAAQIAAVQVAAWRRQYAGVLPEEVLGALQTEPLAAAWHEALTRPRDARQRVLVAVERVAVCGYALTGPSEDPDADPVADGEIGELVVHPEHARAGHGSRLLHACIDTLRADRFTRGAFWLANADDVRRAFLVESGWAPDGAHRELDLRGDGEVRVRQVRLHTDLGPGA